MRRYEFTTSRGVFYIEPRGKQWVVKFGDEELGKYASALIAAENLAGGHTFWPSAGDPSALGVPEDLSDWVRVS